MNKKLILILLIVLLAAGGAAGFYWWKSQQTTKEVEELKKQKEAVWNEYATEDKHMHTLKDFLISAGQGDYVIKMTLTVDFKDDESYLKFLGHSSKEEGEKALEEAGGHGSEEEHLTPMEIALNDGVGKLMMKATDEQIHDKDALKDYLFKNLYKELHLKENNLHGLYIENYVVQ